jgi:hypothetical protein
MPERSEEGERGEGSVHIAGFKFVQGQEFGFSLEFGIYFIYFF